MATKGSLATEERLEIVETLKRGNLSHRAIAKQFNRSQSTISSIAKDAGISPTHRRKRTPAAKDIEGSFTRQERISLTDRALGIIGSFLESGGLNPRELRETTAALKETLDARRSEDVEESEASNKSSEEQFVDVGLGELRVPRNDPYLRDLVSEEIEDGTYWEKRWQQDKAEYDALKAQGIEQPWREPDDG